MNAPDRATDLLAHVLAQLPDARRSRSGWWQARCPVPDHGPHGDRKPSFGCKEDAHGRLHFKCLKGCPDTAIRHALGLTADAPRPIPTRPLDPERLRERPQPKRADPLRRRDIAYVYTDELGQPLHRTVRTTPKGFFQQHYADGGWWQGLGDVARVLYHLPALRAADPAEIVCVVEGEKDAETLRALGFVATTNAMGAGAPWLDSYTAELAGRDVILCEDHDTAGHERVQAAAQALHGHAGRVRIVAFPNLPEHGDVSDWLALGYDAGHLRAAIDTAPDWTPPAHDPVAPATPGHDPQEEGDPYDPDLWAQDYGLPVSGFWVVTAFLRHYAELVGRVDLQDVLLSRQPRLQRNRKLKAKAVIAPRLVNDYASKVSRGLTHDGGWAPLCYEGDEQGNGSFAAEVGYDPGTVRRHAKEMEKAKLGLELRPVPRQGRYGHAVEYRIPNATAFLDTLAVYDPQDGRYKGEEPKLVIPACPDHPDADLIRYDTYVCAGTIGDGVNCATTLYRTPRGEGKRFKRSALPCNMQPSPDHAETHAPDVDPRDLQPILSWNQDGQEVSASTGMHSARQKEDVLQPCNLHASPPDPSPPPPRPTPPPVPSYGFPDDFRPPAPPGPAPGASLPLLDQLAARYADEEAPS